MKVASASVILAAYTHFGARGLKGVGMYHIVKEAWRRGWVERVLAVSKSHCQYEFDLDLVHTLPGESRLVNGLGLVRAKLWRDFPSRWIGEVLFDRFAASRLEGRNKILIATPGLVRTTRRAKILGYTTCLYGGHSDPAFLLEQIELERSVFGLKNERHNRVRSWEMARFAAHIEASDYILAISEFAARSYINRGFPAERIFTVPLGVDLTKFSATAPPTSKQMTYLFMAHASGSTGILKGLPYLLQAWQELELQNARLLICGHIGQEVRDLVDRFRGKLANVEFVGSVSDPAKYYQLASVLIFPSLAEGFGKVVLEAMASGRPVITTAIPKPAVRDGLDGFYISPRSISDLKEKISYFYKRPQEVARMGANASERARRFSWDAFSVQVADSLAAMRDRSYEKEWKRETQPLAAAGSV